MIWEKSMNEEKKKKTINAGINGALYEDIQKYGSAIKEHVVAYEGIDNETQKQLVKGLKQIAKEKINPDYAFQNIQQQAGFAAEVKQVARSNAENIIKGNNVRRIRTDDLGSVNDPLYDLADLNGKGEILSGSGTQMKFLGASEKDPERLNDAKRALAKLQSSKYQKYLDNDVKLEVPSNQYEKMIKEANNSIDDLQKQLIRVKAEGKEQQANQIQERIDKLNKIKKNLRKSSVSSDEAVQARLNPKISTATDVTKIAAQAGIHTGATSAVLGGSVSIVKNLVAVCKGEIDAMDATENVVKDTMVHGGTGFVTGFSGSVIKGVMQNSKSAVTRAASQTNVPGVIVSVTLTAGKTLKRYFDGEMDGTECFETLGEDGVGMLSSAMFTVIGQAAIPIPVVGGMIGSMIGYSLSSASYSVLLEALKDEKLAKEERQRIEKECNEHIELIQEYRAEMNRLIDQYLIENTMVFEKSFNGIKNALNIGDVDWVIDSANQISEQFGRKASFSNQDEFDELMLSDTVFKF